jgi:branched-chain amino acid transport system ATP-binding protein
MSEELLSGKDIFAAYYGDLPVLRGVSFSVRKGQVVAVVGPNGSGKSTLLKTVLGIVPLLRGKVEFLGRTLVRVRPEEIIRQGVGYVPQGHQVFPNLTVRENLEMGCYWMDRDETHSAVERILGRLPQLRSLVDRAAGVLSGGEQQLVSIGRALVHCPKILLVDEPSAGLSPRNVAEVFGILRELRGEGIGILLVEQKAKLALQFADEALILDMGRVVMSGPAKMLLDEERVRSVYLGGS